MGDRLNIIIKQYKDEPPVYVYSHWGGNALIQSGLEEAMAAAAGRVGDPHYYTALFIVRIAQMGYLSGVGTSADDSNHADITIDSMTGKKT